MKFIVGRNPSKILIKKFVLHYIDININFSARHFFVCSCQVISFITVAFSSNLIVSLAGVAFASIGSGLGEISYLSLASHYSVYVFSLLCIA